MILFTNCFITLVFVNQSLALTGLLNLNYTEKERKIESTQSIRQEENSSFINTIIVLCMIFFLYKVIIDGTKV